MELIVLRHGEAGNRQKLIVIDTKRGLTAAGRKEIEEVAKSLSRLKIEPDRIITSPLVRARETAEIVAKTHQTRVEDWDELKPEGSRQQLYRKLSSLKSTSSVMIVGHEPYLSTMICEIIGAPGGRLVLKKGGLAKIRVDSLIPKVTGELKWLLSPGLMKKL